MKKSIILHAIFILSWLSVSYSSYSQSIEAAALAGITFTEKMYFLEGGWGRIDNGFSYGLSVGKRLKTNSYAEISLSREDATGSYSAKDYSTGTYVSGDNIKVHVTYFMAGYGWLLGLGASGKTEAFAGMSLGTACFSVEENQENKWMLAPGLKLGIRRMLGAKTGIILQSAYMAPIQRSGQSIYSGTGGTTAENATLSTVNQFSFSAGLTYTFK